MIRVATHDDAARLAAVHAASFADVWDAAALAALMKGEGVTTLCGADGFVMVRVAADEAEILTLAVAPPARGDIYMSRGADGTLPYIGTAPAPVTSTLRPPSHARIAFQSGFTGWRPSRSGRRSGCRH